MTKTVLLGITLASILVASMFGLSALADDPEIPGIKKVSVKSNKGNDYVHVQIKTDDKLPKDGELGLFGYAVLTDGTNNVLAVTTHKCAADSLMQSNAPDSECPAVVGVLTALTDGAVLNEDHDGADWHPHILDLTTPTGYCASAGADLEVDFESTLDEEDPNNVSPTDYVFAVGAKSFNIIGPMDSANIPNNELGGAVAFTIGADADDDGNITDLCVFLES